jgi:hypothetical protein
MKHHSYCPLFPEQQISIVIQHRKVTSHIPYHIANAIHGPKLTKYLYEKETWSPSVFIAITADSFNITFNNFTTVHQIFTAKKFLAFGVTTLSTNETEANTNTFVFVEMKIKTGATFSHAKAHTHSFFALALGPSFTLV